MCRNKTKCKAETDICQLDLVLVTLLSTLIHHRDNKFSFYDELSATTVKISWSNVLRKMITIYDERGIFNYKSILTRFLFKIETILSALTGLFFHDGMFSLLKGLCFVYIE